MTFGSSVSEYVDTIEAIRAIPEIDLGDAAGSKLAIVVDSESNCRDHEIWNTLLHLPGVIDLAIALVAFDEDEETNQHDAIRN